MKTKSETQIFNILKPGSKRNIAYTYRIKMVRDKAVPYDEQIKKAEPAAQLVCDVISSCGQNDREQFVIIMLNGKNAVVGINVVSTGSISSTPVCIREVFKPAILASARAIIISHNHPSGSLKPSKEDLLITGHIATVGELFSITLLDHLIVDTDTGDYYSFSDQALMDDIRRKASGWLKNLN